MAFRIFEALAAGSFLLTDYCDELKDTFEIGTEIETYRSSDELREKVDYYLMHDELRKSIALKGHDKFLKKFTWDARVQEFLNARAVLSGQKQ